MSNSIQPGVISGLPALPDANVHPTPYQLGLSFFQIASSAATLLMNFLAATLVSGVTLSLDFVDPSPQPQSLALNFVAASYSEGLSDPGIFGASGQPTRGAVQEGPISTSGVYTVGNYALQIPVMLKLAFLEAQTPPYPAGFSGQSLLLALTQSYYVAENFPPALTFTLNFQASSYATAISGLYLDFDAQNYGIGSPAPVTVGTPVLPDPPYAIAFITPGTASDTRLNSLVLNEAVI
jgi:hypothetical protein